MRNIVNEKEVVKFITRELNERGIGIRERTVKLIIDSYLRYKRESLVSGYIVDEPKIGSTYCSFRRGNSFTGKVLPTIKLNFDFDKNLKTDIVDRMIKNKDVRLSIIDGKEDLNPGEIKYLNRKFKLEDQSEDDQYD